MHYPSAYMSVTHPGFEETYSIVLMFETGSYTHRVGNSEFQNGLNATNYLKVIPILGEKLDGSLFLGWVGVGWFVYSLEGKGEASIPCTIPPPPLGAS